MTEKHGIFHSQLRVEVDTGGASLDRAKIMSKKETMEDEWRGLK